MIRMEWRVVVKGFGDDLGSRSRGYKVGSAAEVWELESRMIRGSRVLSLFSTKY